MEFVLPDWFYQGVLDRRLVLAIDPGYFRLTGGIERWLYRVARKHAGRQLNGWRFELRHLHAKSASQSRFYDFALHIRAIVRSQTLPGYVLELVPGPGSETLRVMRPDRKHVVTGTSVSVRVDHGRCWIITKKHKLPTK